MTNSAVSATSALHRSEIYMRDGLRFGLAGAGTFMTLLSLYAVGRWLLGYSEVSIRTFAVAFHVATVIPAIPLGAYVLFARKGGAKHKLLGRIWLTLMGVTAVSTLFIRDANEGQFSWIHIFTVLTFIAVPQAITSARKGDIRAHRKHLMTFYSGALILAGITAFAPGRTMWHWAFG